MNFLPSPLPPFPLGRGETREMAYLGGIHAAQIGHFAEISPPLEGRGRGWGDFLDLGGTFIFQIWNC
jgi:hypothetical protein